MSKSYEKVNYLLRLRKQIERKLIIEVLQHMTDVVDAKNYHYLGFGSVFFADFILFHKYLNISAMSSIDDKVDDEKRFRFNKPYHFIDFKISKSTAFLTKDLNWNDNLLIWLDYDTVLSSTVIEDIELIGTKAKYSDMLIVTIEATKPTNGEEFLLEFKDYIPAATRIKEVVENFQRVLCWIMNSCVRNGINRRTSQIKFLQLFSLAYRDTKDMYTYGGIFCDETTEKKITNKVSDLHFISHGDKVVKIDCPILSPKEKIYLDGFVKAAGKIDRRYTRKCGISSEDIRRYCEYYKYYPQFFESLY